MKRMRFGPIKDLGSMAPVTWSSSSSSDDDDDDDDDEANAGIHNSCSMEWMRCFAPAKDVRLMGSAEPEP
mgnify:CR=1 FL=1